MNFRIETLILPVALLALAPVNQTPAATIAVDDVNGPREAHVEFFYDLHELDSYLANSASPPLPISRPEDSFKELQFAQNFSLRMMRQSDRAILAVSNYGTNSIQFDAVQLDLLCYSTLGYDVVERQMEADLPDNYRETDVVVAPGSTKYVFQTCPVGSRYVFGEAHVRYPNFSPQEGRRPSPTAATAKNVAMNLSQDHEPVTIYGAFGVEIDAILSADFFQSQGQGFGTVVFRNNGNSYVTFGDSLYSSQTTPIGLGVNCLSPSRYATPQEVMYQNLPSRHFTLAPGESREVSILCPVGYDLVNASFSAEWEDADVLAAAYQ